MIRVSCSVRTKRREGLFTKEVAEFTGRAGVGEKDNAETQRARRFAESWVGVGWIVSRVPWSVNRDPWG